MAVVAVTLWAASSDSTEVEISDPGVYDLPQLCERMRATGAEVYIAAQVPKCWIYVSAGHYSPGKLLEWVSQAAGLAVRGIGKVKLLTFPEDEALLRQEQASGTTWLFAREAIARIVEKYAEDLPFGPPIYFREQAERFVMLSSKQREVIWEALALRAISKARIQQGLGALQGRGIRMQLDQQTSAQLEEMLRISSILVRPSFDVYVHKCSPAGDIPISIGFPVE